MFDGRGPGTWRVKASGKHNSSPGHTGAALTLWADWVTGSGIDGCFVPAHESWETGDEVKRSRVPS